MQETYIAIAQSKEFAKAVSLYNALAAVTGQKTTASVDDIVKALRNETTFARISNLKAGLFTTGEHKALTAFYLQGSPNAIYGARAARHELIHLGAALRGQSDTVTHEILVHAAATPEFLIASAGFLGGGIAAGWWISGE